MKKLCKLCSAANIKNLASSFENESIDEHTLMTFFSDHWQSKYFNDFVRQISFVLRLSAPSQDESHKSFLTYM